MDGEGGTDVRTALSVHSSVLTWPAPCPVPRCGPETVAVAAALAGEFPDGVAFVALAPLAEPGLVVPAIAQALGVREAPGRSPGERLREHLRDRRALLVLD